MLYNLFQIIEKKYGKQLNLFYDIKTWQTLYKNTKIKADLYYEYRFTNEPIRNVYAGHLLATQ